MISDTFEKVLRLYFHAEVSQDIQELQQFLGNKRFPARYDDFKLELANKINQRDLSVKDFERLTGIDYEVQEEVNEFLINEIWKPLYGDEPVEGYAKSK